MSSPAEIRDLIRRIAGSGNQGPITFVAEVVSTTEQDCTVKLGEMELTGVRLYSQAAEGGNLLLKPKPGCMALIMADSQMRDLQLLQADSITLLRWQENGLVIEYDSESGKLDVKNDSVGLKDLFQALADIVKQLTLSTPAGPSGTPLPPTLQQVTQFETNFKSLLK